MEEETHDPDVLPKHESKFVVRPLLEIAGHVPRIRNESETVELIL